MRIKTAPLSLVCAALVVLTGACGPKDLKATVSSIAKAQGVDESSVMGALRGVARTEDDQLKLARTWERELPRTRLPDMAARINRYRVQLQDAAVDALRSTACEAVIDVINTGQVPSPAAFAEAYLQNAVFKDVPQVVLDGIADDFASLYAEAVAGTLTDPQVRLTFMKYQYC